MPAMDHSITHEQLQKELAICLRKKLTPYVKSSPGIGKSDAARKFADEYGLKVIDLRLSQCTPEDLQGFPMRDGDKATFTPFSLFPLEGEAVPKGYNGWLLLLDELSSANKAVQAAAYKIILDRQVGSFTLNEKCAIMACGNKITDKAVVHKMSTALQSRLIHYDLEVSLDAWIKWAIAKNIDYRIIGFLRFEQKHLMNFDPDHEDHTYACPRTWEFLDRLIRDEPVNRTEHTPRICGTVGTGAGMEFLQFCEMQKDIPDWADVIDININSKIGIPKEASAKFATSVWAAQKVQQTELAALLPFIQRFEPDMQVIFCQIVLQRLPDADEKIPEFRDYAMNMMIDMRKEV